MEEKHATRGIFTSIAEMIAVKMPELKKKLKVADMKETPVEFLEKAVSTTFFISRI